MAKKVTASKDFKPGKNDLADAKERVKKIIPLLKKAYPEARCALEHQNPLELLIATILSAQCTDVRVNIVTKDLFRKYRSARDYAEADISALEDDIKSTGFYHNKAKNIQGACAAMIAKHGGEVPATMEELTALPGVGRKTANVILGNAFGIPGVVTDTHVIRLSRLIGLSANTDAVKLEQDLMAMAPKKEWTLFSHLLIFHGRQVCVARRPDCGNCCIRALCAYGKNF